MLYLMKKKEEQIMFMKKEEKEYLRILVTQIAMAGGTIGEINRVTLEALEYASKLDVSNFVTKEEIETTDPIEFINLLSDKYDKYLKNKKTARVAVGKVIQAKLLVLVKNPIIKSWTFALDDKEEVRKFETLEDANDYCDERIKNSYLTVKDFKVVIEVEQ